MCNEQITFWDNLKVKSRVVFIETDTELHKDFKKGSEFELFMEQSENYIIFHENVFYGPMKTKCRKVV